MAEAVEFSKSSTNSFIKTSEEFENSIKSRLGWSKKQWVTSGENATRINKLVNSFNYWKNKLKPALVDNSIVFTVFNVENDVKTDLFHIIASIEKLKPDIKVQGFSEFRNPRYLCIYLKDKEERDFVVKNFLMLDDSFIAYLHWAFERDYNVITLKVHWLPMAFNIKAIEKALENYVKCIEHQRYEITFMSGRNLTSGKVVFRAAVNEGYSIENIPHLMNVENMEALITVPGRLPLCLNCEKLGHISKKCKMRYCPECDELKVKKHECMDNTNKTSYASKVKGSDEQSIMADDEDWEAAIVTNGLSKMDKEKYLLSEKIAVLEEKINGNNKVGDICLASDLERKLNGENQKVIDLLAKATTLQEASLSSGEEDMEYGFMTEEESEVAADGSNASVHGNVEKTRGGWVLNKSKKNQNKGKKRDISKTAKSSVQTKKVNNNEDNLHGLRSYGKLVPNSRRKQKEDKKFEKLMQNPEFIFTDQE